MSVFRLHHGGQRATNNNRISGKMLDLLKLAAKYSASNSQSDKRIFFIGAVGIRDDGRLVHSRNDAVLDTNTYDLYRRFPESHAEARLIRKLGFNAIVYVARVRKGSGLLAMARPCERCRSILKAARVQKVFYTITNNEWGIWNPNTNTDIIYDR